MYFLFFVLVNLSKLSNDVLVRYFSSGRIAQSVERWSNKPLVMGSSPIVTTFFPLRFLVGRDVIHSFDSSVGRALD